MQANVPVIIITRIAFIFSICSRIITNCYSMSKGDLINVELGGSVKNSRKNDPLASYFFCVKQMHCTSEFAVYFANGLYCAQMY